MSILSDKLKAAVGKAEDAIAESKDEVANILKDAAGEGQVGSVGAENSVGLNDGATEEPVVGGEFDTTGVNDLVENVLKTTFAEAASYEPPVGSYEKGRIHRVVLGDGTVVKPNVFGVYENPEGEVLELLKYYAVKGLVSLVE